MHRRDQAEPISIFRATYLSSNSIDVWEKGGRNTCFRPIIRVVFAGGTGERVLVTEFRGMALNCLFCADVLRPLHLVHLTDFTYKHQPAHDRGQPRLYWT